MSAVERTCKCCRKTFTARSADVARGWAIYCSKSCKAKVQESRTHQHANRIAAPKLSQWEIDDIQHQQDMDDAFPFGSEADFSWGNSL